MRKLATTALLGMALVIGAGLEAAAAELEGIQFPDTATVDGATVQLNGLGVRTAYVFVKVYVGALYLQTKTRDGKAAIETDEAKRIVLHMLRDVTHDEMKQAMKEGLAPAEKTAGPGTEQFMGYFTEPISQGQECEFDYVPGKGTTVAIAGKTKGTIAGAPFMRALWSVWLGPSPVDGALKQGMLGNG
jgi:hypothetical protein